MKQRHPIFNNCPYQELRDVKVVANGMEIVLKGRVSSFYLKQLGFEWVKKRLPAFKVINNLEVATNPKKVKEKS